MRPLILLSPAKTLNFEAALSPALAKAAVGCNRTQVVSLDDESFLYDQQPWPSRSEPDLCAGPPANGSGTAPRAHAPRSFLPRPLAKSVAFAVAARDQFEDEGILWLLNSLVAALVLAWSFCAFHCIKMVNENDDNEI